MSIYTFRVRAPKGLESTLIKELKQLKVSNSIEKVEGRKIIEVKGKQDALWAMLAKSRIVEDVQVKMAKNFLARGDKELETNLKAQPWHCYLPIEGYSQYQMPQTTCKSHASKLYHTQMVREILLQHINELPIQRSFKKLPDHLQRSYKVYRKEWQAKQEGEAGRELRKVDKDAEKRRGDELVDRESQKRIQIKKLDDIKKQLKEKVEERRGKKQLSKIQINIVKDRAEILLGTSYDELHKHGMKPFMRWGVLKETLTAACILEAGILEKANKTGKLFLWDPFCGSGSFLIESLMMMLQMPIRRIEEEMPFEFWPIHDKEGYEKFKEELNDTQKMLKRDDLDIQIIGSDISLKAIETSTNNVAYAETDTLCQSLFQVRNHKIIKTPLIYAQHWPKGNVQSTLSLDTGEQAQNELTENFQSEDLKADQLLKSEENNSLMKNESEGEEEDSAEKNEKLVEAHKRKSEIYRNYSSVVRQQYMSLYQGDFQDIGYRLAAITDDFKDFQVLTNVPYGVQSKTSQRQTDTDLMRLYRRFGRFLKLYPNLEKNAFVLAQAHHYGHKLSFEKFSNCGWDKVMHFSNSGLSVQLMKMDQTQVSSIKTTIEAYKSLAAV